VELALVMPLLVGVVAVLFQLGILFVVYLSMMHATRDVGRWISVHPDTTDAAFQQYVQAHMPSTLIPSELTPTISPTCAALSNGRCASRPSGTALRIRMTYDASASIFLPSRVSLGFFNATIPIVLPPYEYYVMAEQR
jgi:hypothetical protein